MLKLLRLQGLHMSFLLSSLLYFEYFCDVFWRYLIQDRFACLNFLVLIPIGCLTELDEAVSTWKWFKIGVRSDVVLGVAELVRSKPAHFAG